ncbi:hypothetical protein AB0368_03490 [Actinoplanes sp. NPDC051475]|uniref:hypothetical protein n=1 Tax=Actinoplanes sp. NPDC051475 TaxID=3157225 RepID=UPI00345098AA
MTALRQAFATVAAVVVLVLGTGAPALAHAGGLTATDVRGRVVAVTPGVAGLAVTAIEDGARLRLRNDTAVAVTVPAGGGTATPAVVGPGTERTWLDSRSTAVGRTVAPGRTEPWSLVLDVGGTPVTVSGELTGGQPPAALPWWVATVVLAVAVPVMSRRLRRPDLVLAAAGAVALAASAAHVTGSTLAVESAPALGTFLGACGVNLLGWPLVAGGAAVVLRGRPAGVLGVCAGAALIAVSVLPDVTSFHRAVLPFAGPAAAERALVVLTLGAGVGVAVAGAAVLRTFSARSGAEAA